MTTSVSARVRTTAPAVRRGRWSRAGAVLGAAAAAALGWVVAVPIAGVDLDASMGGRAQPIGLVSVVVVSLVVGLLGWGLLALLESRTRRAGGIWTVVAMAVAVLSLGGPLTSAVSFSAAAVLAGLHLMVAAVLIPLLRRSSFRK